ncbi:hypothetical protein BDA96_05G126800 [Sorghum bicolor]|uniref:Secreted protein n=1 Tax=Sorghum bicolor TaxID=4558 RepID=A0A921QX06_SORBI|nr:hypothetical protein BDA96_05G126800 [Sorghum bicolor]
MSASVSLFSLSSCLFFFTPSTARPHRSMTSQAHSSSIPEQLGNIPMREDQQNVERIILHRIDKDVDLSLVLPWL